MKNNKSLISLTSYVVLFFFLIFSTGFAQNSQASNNDANPELCKALNSISIYTPSNLQIFQNYLKKYFPNVKVTGNNDNQNKYYIGKYQIAFGLKATGQLNTETLKLLKNQNKCFDLEKKVLLIEKSTPIILMDQASLLYNIITNYIFQPSITNSSQEYATVLVTSNSFSNENLVIVNLPSSTSSASTSTNAETPVSPISETPENSQTQVVVPITETYYQEDFQEVDIFLPRNSDYQILE